MSPASLYVCVLVMSLLNKGQAQVIYKSSTGKDCVADAYRQVLFAVDTKIECASHCTAKDQCSSFKMSGRNCHLFVYTKMSYKVNKIKTCAANEEEIWFKENSYKECPVDFGHEFYGTKYKFVTAFKTHTNAIAYCQALGGFSRLADALDHEKLSHLANMSTGNPVVWLDGAQIPGSPEPAGGWQWTAAGKNVDPTMWDQMAGEPNNGNENEHALKLVSFLHKVHDAPSTINIPSICECSSVFN